MATFLIRRLLVAIPTLVLAVTIVFLILRVLPGDIVQMVTTEGGMTLPPATIERLRSEMGLNQPLYQQYVGYFSKLATGDLGSSMFSGRSVRMDILQRLPITLQMAVMAQVIALVVGIPVGIITAIKQDSWPDYILRFLSIIFLAIPGFWLGLLVLLIGVRYFNWMPPVGNHPLWVDPLKNLQQLIWPALILGLAQTAVTARMTRSSMLEVLREDYIRTARAKGLAETTVIMRHALKNALIPVVTLSAIAFASLIAGVVILEQVFSIPGLGTLFIIAINQRDYPVVQGMVFFIAVMFVLVNIVVDLLYGWLDPRISSS